jgi:hypothetical protein
VLRPRHQNTLTTYFAPTTSSILEQMVASVKRFEFENTVMAL